MILNYSMEYHNVNMKRIALPPDELLSEDEDVLEMLNADMSFFQA